MVMFYDLMIEWLSSKDIQVIVGVISALAVLVPSIVYIVKIFYKSFLKGLTKIIILSVCNKRKNLSSDESYLFFEILNKAIKSLSKNFKEDDILYSYKKEINNIKILVEDGGYEKLTKAKKLLEILFNDIIEYANAEITQDVAEGLSSLFLLTNDTQNVNVYYDRIKDKFPNLPRNDKLHKIINKYNVKYPVMCNGNIVLGRIDISRFNEIFNKLEENKESFVRFNINSATNISKKPTNLTWSCKVGYIIYGKNKEILGGSLSENHQERFLSRIYHYDEIKEALLLMNQGIGYRIP